MEAIDLKKLENEIKPTVTNDIEGQKFQQLEGVEVYDYSKRAHWLRAVIICANDGLLLTSTLMIGFGAVRKDAKTMILTGIAGLVAGACSLAIGEFVSVCSQYDIEVAQFKKENMTKSAEKSEMDETKKEKLPNPFQAATLSTIAFVVGAMVPLLSATFICDSM